MMKGGRDIGVVNFTERKGKGVKFYDFIFLYF